MKRYIKEMLGSMRGFFYRLIMRFAHKYNWHYAPPIYPDGDTQLWCKWCGFRETIKRRNDTRKKKTKSIDVSVLEKIRSRNEQL